MSGLSAKRTGGRGLGEPGGSPSRNPARYVGIGAVQLYRHSLGLLVPAGTCKYHPTCSQYALDALEKHGLVRGSLKAGWRLLRCNPWSHGGVDPA